MERATPLVAGSLFFLATMVGASTAAELKFSCKGQVIQEMTDPAVPQKPIEFSVTVGERNTMSIKTSDNKTLVPRISSNNKIQLKFATKDFLGEYFHYSGDLFLIYRSGQLARMNCSRI